MDVKQKTRTAGSMEGLYELLDAIESGQKSKPDWIRMRGHCRIDKLEETERRDVLQRMHKAVLRGFKAKNIDVKGREARLDFWQSVARCGFHDFSELGWMKAYDSPFVENYDYIQPYLEGGLQALDPYAVYSAVLGTFDFTVEDFVSTKLCSEVRTIVEPMAGTADFAYQGHFHYPDFRFLMIDLDDGAQERVLAQNWNEGTEKHYMVADVLEESVWSKAKSITTGESLAYIGKQSHHMLDAKQLFKLMELATTHIDYLMLETPQLSPVTEMGGTDDMTRPEMKDAGFESELVEDPDGDPNPFTNLMHFHLVSSDEDDERAIFGYRNWTVWSQPILVTLARLLDLNVFYYHSELSEFVSVEDEWEDCDVEENVTFMIFTRREVDLGSFRD
ncbi:MAG: hypothetical protein CMN75_17315 [Spirochaeta sp.]|nr:hypothetical protein [Spirochaeta sp.]RPG12656.1 MAG: hypothetical protein CBC32_003115 [Proteobacteria bacterium TMED72]